MITTIRTYRNLRARGLSKAWEISGMPEVGDKLVAIACWIVAIAGLLYLLSDTANAMQAQRESATSGYTHALERTLAACLSDRGGPVKIGDEWFLCAIYPMGRF